jgi:hypothetical protein
MKSFVGVPHCETEEQLSSLGQGLERSDKVDPSESVEVRRGSSEISLWEGI